jgi:hypothetical protein
MVPIHPVVLEKKFVLHISHRVAMLNYGYDRLSNMAARGHKIL